MQITGTREYIEQKQNAAISSILHSECCLLLWSLFFQTDGIFEIICLSWPTTNVKTHFLTNWVRVTGEFPGSRLNFASSSKTRYRVNIYTAVKPTIILRSPRNFTVLMSYINVSWSVILNSKLSGFGCIHTPLITVGRFLGFGLIGLYQWSTNHEILHRP